MYKKVIKNSTVVGLGTLISRFLGFIRDILIARFFGTGGLLEAFLVAFRIPNVLRSLFGEGFSDAVATPVLSEHRKDKNELFKISNHLFLIMALVLALLCVFGILFSKYLVIVAAPGFVKDAAKFSMAVSFTKVTFLYLFLIGLSSAMKSTLFALKKFFVPAFSPCLLNISFIAGILLFRLVFENNILVFCVIAAGVLELIVSFSALKTQGFKLSVNLKEAVKNSAVKRMFKLFLPRVWSAAVYHINVFIDTIFSSLYWIVGQGALAAVYYANRIIQFPLALVALSISRVMVVDLSSFYKDDNMDDFKRLFLFSLKNMIFFIVPITIIFLLSAKNVIAVIFMSGKFDSYSLSLTATSFYFYSFGLLFFCGIKVLVHAFYALKDTFTPAKIATLSLVINAGLNALFVYTDVLPIFPLKVGGIAFASSVAAGVNFFLLYKALVNRVGKITWQGFFIYLLKLVIIGLCTGYIFNGILDLNFNRYLKLLSALLAGTFSFFSLGFVFKLQQVEKIISWIKLSLQK